MLVKITARAISRISGRKGWRMSLRDFLAKQFVDVIQWNEPEEGILAYRHPMMNMEIQTGAKLTVRESQMAVFVNEGRIADVFSPGLYTLNTHNLPLLTDLLNWDKEFESPFKSDVYFFSTRIHMDKRWGTPSTITIREKILEPCGCVPTGFIRIASPILVSSS